MKLETKSSMSVAALNAAHTSEVQAAVHMRRIPATPVRQLCGGISDMTLWRWLKDPDMGFPQPVRIQKRRYWLEAEVLAWIEEQASSQ